MSLLLSSIFSAVCLITILNIIIQPSQVLVKLLNLDLQTRNAGLHVILICFSHQCFPHAISNRWFIECLIGVDSHRYLVTHSHEEEAALCTVDCDLADDFVECLVVEAFADRTDAGLAGSALGELQVQRVLEVDYIDSGSGGRTDVTHPKLPVFSVFPRG